MDAEPPVHNTYIHNPESETELARLIKQDRRITEAMNGPIADIADPSRLQDILDVGCGPGGWATEVAFLLPNSSIEGVDISRTMIDYAQARAQSQQLANVSFTLMDVNHPFKFSDHSFDLVNERFMGAVLFREAWPAFLQECTRILRPGGIFRSTELVSGGITSSQAVNAIMRLITRSLWKAGYGFSPDGYDVGITHELPARLRALGYHSLQLVGYALEHSRNTEAWADQYHNILIGTEKLQPFLLKVGLISQEALAELLQQALLDMHQEHFTAMEYLLTVLATKPL